MNKHILIPLALACLLAGACAKNQSSTTGQNAQEYLSLWMEKYHPGISPDENGLYILDDTPGSGDEWNNQLAYIYATSTICTLGGTVQSTTDEKLSQQLGTYVKGYYYGPRYQIIGSGYSYAGLDALLKGMRIGGTRKAVIPSWMLTTLRYESQEKYLEACTGSTHLVYEISLKGQTDDPELLGIEALTTYVHEHFGEDVESISYISDQDADDSFWFISDVSAFEGQDPLEDNTSVEINYTGRLLDGTVFDTSIEKVAKDAGIYNEQHGYGSQTVTLSSDYSSVTMGSSSSLINGFKGGLSLMKWKGQKATVLFSSAHGYTSSGSGSTIPAFAPLIFELEILP